MGVAIWLAIHFYGEIFVLDGLFLTALECGKRRVFRGCGALEPFQLLCDDGWMRSRFEKSVKKVGF